MATIRRFEEIEAWQKARQLVREVYSCSNSGRFARDFGLRDHIREAGISIMSNIAEGFERGGNAEFRQFLAVAKGSAGEVESKLYVALDQGYLSEKEFEALRGTTIDVKRLIGGFMGYLRRSGMKGPKFVRRPNSTNTLNVSSTTRNSEPGFAKATPGRPGTRNSELGTRN